MDPSRSFYAVKNIKYNLASKIITLILAFISRTVFIWGFGAGYLGINGLFSDVLNLLSMVDLGFGIAMVYSFYQPLASDDRDKISALVGFYRKIYIIIAISVSIIGISMIPVLPMLVNLEENIPNLTVYYLLALANVVASYICVYKTSVLIADQKSYILVRIGIITNIIKTTIQIISIVLLENYIVYLGIGITSTIIYNLIASFIASKTYPYINRKVFFSSKEQKGVGLNLLSVFLYKVSSVLLNATDNILISVIVGTVAVGYYSNYVMVQTQIIAFYSLFFTSITAGVGNLIVTEKSERRYALFEKEDSLGHMAAGIIVPCYILLINDFIVIWLGKDYLLDARTVVAVGLNMYLSCVLQPLWTFREATGLYKKTKWIMMICAVLNIMLSIVLGVIWGIAGILFASVIARLATYVWYEPKLLFSEYFEKSVIGYYFSLLKNAVYVALVSIGLAVLLGINSEKGFGGLIIKSVVVFGVCSMISILFYRKTPGFIHLKTQLIRKK